LPRVGIVCRIQNNDVIIQSIEEKSIAQFTGLQVGDIIRSVQHVPVTGNNAWYIAKVVYDYLDKQTIILEVEGSDGKKIVTIPVSGEN
jgi:C-terminal processing protease CtpA/Prc